MDHCRRHLWRALALTGFACILVASAASARAGEAAFKVMHDFEGPGIDGRFPVSALVLGSDGKLHGTTQDQDADWRGSAFRITPSGQLSVLHVFHDEQAEGAQPAGQTQGSDGHCYGTTFYGGEHFFGVVYRMSPQGEATVLHSFARDGRDGGHPLGKLIQGKDGDFYGTTFLGGRRDTGCVYKVSRHGQVKVLHSFNGSEGSMPETGVIQASDGKLYGTTAFGGSGHGTVFKMSADGVLHVLHRFRQDGHDGMRPGSGLVEGPDGWFYGVTRDGGAYGQGTVYRVSIKGVVSVLHAFAADGIEGRQPMGELLLARDGRFYGVTNAGGRHDQGTVYAITSEGAFSRLHSFDAAQAGPIHPEAGLVEVADGEFYGTTPAGGALGLGTIYRVRLK